MSFPFSKFARRGVKLVDQFTQDGQVEITHEAWIAQDKFGKPQYAAPTDPAPRCVIDSRQRVVVTTGGQAITIMSTLTFTSPTASNGAPGRREPIDPRDKITLPNGFTGPIIDSAAPIDPKTNMGYIQQIMLGAR